MKTFFTALSALLLSTASGAKAENPAWLHDAVIYHIYPSTYADSDGDGTGDLEGIRSRLDYIRSLGFNTVWISPVFQSEFEDGGYDITDYYMVDKRFGTNRQLVQLIQDAHDKGIKVCLDLVAGHTSDKHPWFRQSCSADTSLHYSDFYIWNDDKSVLPDKNFVKSDAPRNGNFLKNYFDIQPALNYGYAHPDTSAPWQQSTDAPGPRAVKQEIKNIMDFWMSKGVDGFRCDMAPSLIKGDDSNYTANKQLWREFRQWVDENHPGCILISEWSQPSNAIDAGFHIDLIIHNKYGNDMYRPLFCHTTNNGKTVTPCFFDKAGNGQVDRFVKRYTEQYLATRGRGFMAMPTCSHDIWRINRFDRNTPGELKTALTFFLTLPGIPIVYYGEEIGMRNIEDAPEKEGSFSSKNRSSCRTPMQWDTSDNAGFSTAAADRLYLPVDPDPARPNVAEQERDPNSILNYVKGLIALRQATPALGTDGAWQYLSPVEHPYPMVFMRELDGEKYIVAINPSARKATAEFASPAPAAEAVYGTTAKASYRSAKGKAKVTMPPVSAVIFHARP